MFKLPNLGETITSKGYIVNGAIGVIGVAATIVAQLFHNPTLLNFGVLIMGVFLSQVLPIWRPVDTKKDAVEVIEKMQPITVLVWLLVLAATIALTVLQSLSGSMMVIG